MTFPTKRNPKEVDSTKLTEPVFTDEDWIDFRRGIEFFNSRKFWHAHEAWEQVWRRHHEDSRLFLQGLIQMAAGFHLIIEKQRFRGAFSNLNKALERLKLFEPEFLNLPVRELIVSIEAAKEEIGRQHAEGTRKGYQWQPPVILFVQKREHD